MALTTDHCGGDEEIRDRYQGFAGPVGQALGAKPDERFAAPAEINELDVPAALEELWAMTNIDKTLNSALNMVDELVDSVISTRTTVVEKVVARGSSAAKPITLTIARPRGEVEELWRDAARLSRIMGTVADVTATAPNRYRWTVYLPGDQDVAWDSDLIEITDGWRFVGAGEGPAAKGTTAVSVVFRDAPADLGTEVTLSLRLPAPDIVLRGAAFKALYRARALLQTGELPTLTPTPAARPGNR